jgi:hypothetical protein
MSTLGSQQRGMPLLVTNTKRGIYAKDPMHILDLKRSGDSSSVIATCVVVDECSRSLHQPLTWVDRSGNVGAAPPSLDNPYMSAEEYDKWTNICENGK